VTPPPLPERPWNGRYVLDAYACAGGATMGYYLAGYRVVAVDINDQPNHPGRQHRTEEIQFIQGDAVDHIRRYGSAFHLIHTSPPCQSKCGLTVGTNASRGWGGEHVDLVGPTREALLTTGRPYIIEQPNGQADVRKDITLCGEMFGLGVLRHRNFELGGWTMPKPAHRKHRGYTRGWRHGVYRDGPYIAAYGKGGGKRTVPEMQAAMGIGWTDVREELTEAIPPAYSELLARHAFQHMAGVPAPAAA